MLSWTFVPFTTMRRIYECSSPLHTDMLLLLSRIPYFSFAGRTACFRACWIDTLSMLPTLLCDSPTASDDVSFVEEPVDFLECQIGGLGIAELHASVRSYMQ
jgi:hypothetical protein